MRRFAILTVLTWLGVIASIAMFFVFWRMGNLRPHALWAVTSFALIALPMTALSIITMQRIIHGPCRWRVFGWWLIGATPIVWVCVYIAQLTIVVNTREPVSMNALSSIAATWASSVFDIQARLQYSRWTHGQHAVLIDNGDIPNAKELVSQMDTHIQAMAQHLNQPVPECEFPWVRGSLLGQERRSVLLWALCGEDKKPSEVVHLDRHEIAHTLISALAGPDHEPPFVLIEGWAESQSSDRNLQISSLSKKQKNNQTYSLQELVGPYWYGRGSGPVYWQGGPLANFLMEQYGVDAFYQLYTEVRQKTFHEDCKTILGDSWQDVETNFWNWVETEAELIASQAPQKAKKKRKYREDTIELASTIDPADWKAFAEGYKQAIKGRQPLPTNLAFSIGLARTFIDERADTPDEKTNYECLASFSGQDFWIFENLSSNINRFLLATKDRCADLEQDEDGVVTGWIRGQHAYGKIRTEAIQLLPIFYPRYDPADLLPLLRKNKRSKTCTITDLIRPEEGSEKPWSISYTWQADDDPKKISNQILVDPSSGWSIVRYTTQKPGEQESVSETEYQFIGGAYVPKKSTSHFEEDFYVVNTEMHLLPLSQSEQKELQQRVEKIVSAGPTEPYSFLRQFLIAIDFAIPLIGLLILKFASREETSP